MELEIIKNSFLEVGKISSIKGHIGKIIKNNIDLNKASGTIEIDISYTDSDNNECFESKTFDYDMQLEEVTIEQISIKNINAYVVEGRGVNVDYTLLIECSNDIKANIETINLTEECIEEEIEKIKEDISKDYENKLADNLSQRVSIISSKSNFEEVDFLRFFDETQASYFQIKTLTCRSEKDLNEISKLYKVSLDNLLVGYDRSNGRVTFKYNK